MTVTLEGYIDVPEPRRSAIKHALPDHIQHSRAEPGCLRFDVTEDTDVPGRFHVSETFTDAAAFEAHQARIKASDWGRISAGIERHYRVTGL
ncbi:autoinducer-2 (AI-2) modifying protein LsrG [Tritonibacter multivorans]|uniref:Autoinducer-2 (AI-2) modifying protein LsrG n=1 Tax=Tritonibacter multivorans TaxID=928856 RepID=A0A0P1GJB2_9RHOB|nr:putative quinol monooxygenase [Tritonibacter multivorans]MDA7421557.1 putative quinol monooxygenase [Tritonibacter multivorans]CUH82179.1 autoinducer-2 (AI-2) modifying protein LsrG [Tritonibacter multivorans]SFC95698.1 Antibiotic biosynthesis monooxygenase [Tritonibacter multivorans]